MRAATGSNLIGPAGTVSPNPESGSASGAAVGAGNVVRDRDQLAWALANTAEFVVEGNRELRAYAEHLLDGPGEARVMPHAPLPAAPRAGRARWRLIAAIFLAVLMLAGLALVLLQHRGSPLPPPHVAAGPVAPGWSFDGVVQIGWVVVALVAVIAIYRLIGKAIDGDRNVELAWKITEKASGRLVIKKVPIRSPGR